MLPRPMCPWTSPGFRAASWTGPLSNPLHGAVGRGGAGSKAPTSPLRRPQTLSPASPLPATGTTVQALQLPTTTAAEAGTKALGGPALSPSPRAGLLGPGRAMLGGGGGVLLVPWGVAAEVSRPAAEGLAGVQMMTRGLSRPTSCRFPSRRGLRLLGPLGGTLRRPRSILRPRVPGMHGLPTPLLLIGQGTWTWTLTGRGARGWSGAAPHCFSRHVVRFPQESPSHEASCLQATILEQIDI